MTETSKWFDVKNFFDKWLIDLTFDQRSDGAVPGVVPHNNYLDPTMVEVLRFNNNNYFYV